MSAVSDETLMAFADGALSAHDESALRARLAVDHGLRARLAPFTSTHALGSTLFKGFLDQPLPPHLIDAVRRAAEARVERGGDVEVPAIRKGFAAALSDLTRFAFAPQQHSWATAGALGGVLMAGLLAGMLVGTRSTSTPLDIVASNGEALMAQGALAEALEKMPSQSAGGVGITPVLTFKTQSGGFCRQYRAAVAGAPSYQGVACRAGKGAWRIETHVAEGSSLGAVPAGETSGSHKSAGDLRNPSVEAAVDRLIAGVALGGTEEASEIAHGWGKTTSP